MEESACSKLSNMRVMPRDRESLLYAMQYAYYAGNHCTAAALILIAAQPEIELCYDFMKVKTSTLPQSINSFYYLVLVVDITLMQKNIFLHSAIRSAIICSI